MAETNSFENITWDQFKAFLNADSLSFQEFKLMDVLNDPLVLKTYRLRILDDGFPFQTFIHADGDMPTEKTDYETNYQADANQPVFFLERVDIATPLITYRGKAKIGTLPSAAKWQIIREVKVGNETIPDSLDGGKKTQVWNNRTTLFPNPPYLPTKSLQFDGGNDFVSIPHHADFDKGRLQKLSMSMWVKTTEIGAQTFMEKMLSNVGWRLFITNQRPRVDFRGITGRIQINTDDQQPTLLNGSWHLLVYTYDGSGNASGWKISIDKVFKTMDPTPADDNLTTDPLNIGDVAYGSRTGGSDNFDGNIHAPAFWSRELTQADIDEIYNSGNPDNLNVHTNAADIEMWHSMNGIVFPNVPDEAGNHDGTMDGMVVGDIESEFPGS